MLVDNEALVADRTSVADEMFAADELLLAGSDGPTEVGSDDYMVVGGKRVPMSSYDPRYALLLKTPSCYRAHIFRTLFTSKSLLYPYDFTISQRLHDFATLSLSLYPDNHSFVPFIYLPFHTSQEQGTAHGLHLTIRYWYMRIDIAIVREPSPTRSTRRRPSHELGSLVISALPRRA